MHFEAPPKSFPQNDEITAFLLAQATQFVNQNTVDANVVQTDVQLQPYQRQHIHHNLKIQPYYSDYGVLTQHAKPYPIIPDNPVDDIDMDLDAYLTRQAEQLVCNALGGQVGVENIYSTLPPTQYKAPAIKRFATQDHIKAPIQNVQQVRQVQEVQQLNHIKSAKQIQQVQKIQYYTPQVQETQKPNYAQPLQKFQQAQFYTPQVQVLPQVQVQANHIMKPRVQIEYGTPYIVENNRQVDVPLPQVQRQQLVVPSPAVQRQVVAQNEVVSPSPAPQRQVIVQNQVVNPSPPPQRQQIKTANAKPEPAGDPNMQFIQKGPKGEVLYKTTEGGQNFYVKRGLTEEAVNNYNLAYLIGVGPPVEILGTDGVKMEEGVNIRHAVRDKMLTIDEVKEQIQRLHKTLYETGMAHCDVKFENCLYFPKYKKVLLIDNGDLAVYGNRRKIMTPGANSTLLIHGNEERHRVGPATDLRGFMHIMKNATETEINPV